MPKQPISVTLSEANLIWLRGRVAASGHRSVSDLLDRIVDAARSGISGAVAVRSVAGTIDVADDDPDLSTADDYISGLVRSSLNRPVIARERSTGAPSGRRSGRTRG